MAMGEGQEERQKRGLVRGRGHGTVKNKGRGRKIQGG